MKMIDPHHHIWDMDKNHYGWLEADPPIHIFGDYSEICSNYFIADFQADGASSPYELVKSVHIETCYDPSNPPGETAWLDSIATAPASRGMPNAFVAFADFLDPNVDAVLAGHAAFANTRGIRQILNSGVDNPHLNFIERGDLMTDPQWREGYAHMANYTMSFDLQIWPWQMEMAAAMVGDFPEVPVIINHTGMPLAYSYASFKQWEDGMALLAEHAHVSVKISGLPMTMPNWTVDDIRPYVLRTIELFGMERCMFASNYPVDGIFSTYTELWAGFDEVTKDFSDDERSKLFHDNAERIYRI